MTTGFFREECEGRSLDLTCNRDQSSRKGRVFYRHKRSFFETQGNTRQFGIILHELVFGRRGFYGQLTNFRRGWKISRILLSLTVTV